MYGHEGLNFISVNQVSIIIAIMIVILYSGMACTRPGPLILCTEGCDDTTVLTRGEKPVSQARQRLLMLSNGVHA